MLTGFSGHLVSEGYLERYLSEQAPRDLTPERRQFAAWRRGCRGLGPASSVRALVDVGLDPLVRLLRLLPAVLQQRPDAAVGVARAGSHAVVLAVCGWGERLDPLWRVAIGQARASALIGRCSSTAFASAR